MTDSTHYNRVAVLLHWLVGLAILAQLSLGLWMEDVPKSPPGVRASWFNLHKSTGIVLALLIAIRIVWRLIHSAPAFPSVMNGLQKTLATWSHRLLYTCMVVMPLSGFLGSSFTPYPIKFFGTPLPRLWGADPDMKEILAVVHSSTAWVFVTLIAIHLLAACIHLVKRDGVLSRMTLNAGANSESSPTPNHSPNQD
jgi:cytochrome b561